MTHEEILKEIKVKYEKMANPMMYTYEAVYGLKNEENQVVDFTQVEITKMINESNNVRWGTSFVGSVLRQLAKDGYFYRKAGVKGEATRYAFPKEDFFEKPTWESGEKFDSLTREMKIRKAFKTLLPIAEEIESEQKLEEFLINLKSEYEYFIDNFKLNSYF